MRACFKCDVTALSWEPRSESAVLGNPVDAQTRHTGDFLQVFDRLRPSQL